MKKINDYSEVSPIIMKFFKRGVITNNFLTPQSYKYEILGGNLFMDITDGNLYIYVKRNGFYILYFYILNKESFFVSCDKIVSEATGEASEILIKNGFSNILSRVKLEAELSSADNLLVSKADYTDKIYDVLSLCFSEYTAYLPTKEELKLECEKGLIYTDKNTVSVLRTGESGKNVQIKHLAVLPEYRKNGLANSLLEKFSFDNSGKKCTVWTGEENEKALSLYKKFGFNLTDMKSYVYMKG